jgi:hypothetical protein
MILPVNTTNAARAYGSLCVAIAIAIVAEHFAFAVWEVLALATSIGLGVFLLATSTP